MSEIIKNENLIILDTNFFLIPIQFGVDVYDEIRNKISGKIKFVIVSEVMNELENKIHREKKIKFKHIADRSLEFLDIKKRKSPELFQTYEEKKTVNISVDDFIIMIAKKLRKISKNVYIASNDKLVKKKALSSGVFIIYLRQKSKIEVSYE